MNLLIYSHYFSPSGGGGESIVQSLASGIAEFRTLNGDREFNVTVVTETRAGCYDDAKSPLRVARRAGVIGLWQLVRASDVISRGWPGIFTHVSGCAVTQAIRCRTPWLSSNLP